MKRKKILLVEDDSIIALLESELLQSGGYEVLVTHSGEKALEIFRSDPGIDLVLMDIDLGTGMDGGETARQMLAEKEVPVVFISSHTEPEILAKTEAITSYGYIVKGSSETAIFASLNMAFRLYEAHLELIKKNVELKALADNLSETIKKLMETQLELLTREQKLKETTEHLEATLNSLPDLLFELDQEGTYLDLRAPKPELLVRPREELLGRRVNEVLPEDISEALLFALKEAAEKGISEINYSLDLPSGRHYFEATIARKGTNRPGQNTFVALVRDITDRIEAQLAQQKTEIRFYRLFQAMAEGVAIHRLIFDQKGQPIDYEIVEVNDSFTRHTGITRQRALGQKASELYGSGQPPFFETYLKAVESGKAISFESFFESLQRYFKITAFPMGEDLFTTVFEDITQRKKTEIDLKEREERYRLIFQNTPLGILQFDRNGVITECNEAFVKIIGSSREALIGFNILERVKDEKVIEAVKAALAGKVGYYEGIYKSVTADKSTPARGFFAGIFDENGEFLSGIGTFEDFTERYQTEKALQQSEAILEAMFEGSVHSFIFLDPEGKIMKFNRIAQKRMISLIGQSLKIGQPLVELIPETFRPDFNRNFMRAVSGELVQVEIEITTLSGEKVWYEFYLTPIFSETQSLLGVFLMAQDVTARKKAEEALRESEERFRTIFEGSGAIMLVIDPQSGNIYDANYRTEEFYGYPREKLRQMNIKEINTLPAEEVERRMAEARERRQNHFIFTHRLASGETREVEVYSHPIRFGEKNYLLSVIIDITERLNMEKELQRTVKEKIAILQELQHRVKNTFALINSIINLELTRIAEKEVRAPLENLKARILTISRVYDQLSMRERYQEIGLDRFLRDIFEAITWAYAGSGPEIELQFELEPLILDVRRALPIGLIATEILTNALKHAFEGREKGLISIQLKKTDNQILLQISDNGRGLPEGWLTGTSTGLGQIIIKTLADQLEVRLETESQPETGTLFRLILPLSSKKSILRTPG
jgi:PAS domain S-box-containing protein